MLFSQKFTKKYHLVAIFFLVLLQSSTVHAVENPLNTITLEGNPYSSFFVGTNRLYVISKEQNRMYLINTNTNKYYSTVRVDNGPTTALTFKDRIYIANSEDNVVSAYYLSTGGYKTKVIVGSGPVGLVGVGNNLYVTSFDDTISVIESGADSRFKNVKLDAGATSSYFTVTGNRIFMHHPINNSVSVWSTSSNTVIKNFAVGQSPQMSVLVGKKLYVINSKSNDVSVVDIDSYSLVKNISVGNHPVYGLISGTKLYILNSESNTLSIIDTTNDTLLKTVNVGRDPVYMNLVDDFIYIVNNNDDTVSFFDTKSEAITKTIAVGDSPQNATLVGKKLYVNNTKSASVSILNTGVPVLNAFTTTTSNGVYSEGTKIKIDAAFDQYLSPNSSLTLVLNNNRELTLTTTTQSSFLSAEYTVQSGDDIADLDVKTIKSADIISLFWHDSKSYTLPTNNLWKLKNIAIKTSGNPNIPPSSNQTICKNTGMYRLCPLTKPLENTVQYRENMICEGFVNEEQSRSKRISRIEVLNIAVNMLHGPKSAATEYDDIYTDITTTGNSQETVSVIQTGLDNNLIFPNNGAFEPTKKISRIEAYALLMRGVCMEPDESTDMARAIHQKAFQEGITTKQWARFRAYSTITRNEVFIVASALADWADKNGGCDKLECRK